MTSELSKHPATDSIRNPHLQEGMREEVVKAHKAVGGSLNSGCSEGRGQEWGRGVRQGTTNTLLQDERAAGCTWSPKGHHATRSLAGLYRKWDDNSPSTLESNYLPSTSYFLGFVKDKWEEMRRTIMKKMMLMCLRLKVGRMNSALLQRVAGRTLKPKSK